MLARTSVLLLVLFGGGCAPFAAEGESCERAPCAFGLACLDDVCAPAPLPDAGPERCSVNADCALQGSADGRVCEDGVCGWAACGFDAQCGTRVCDRGQCTFFEPCLDDEGCDEGRVCGDGACRGACEADDECGALEACAGDGRCRQRCLGDFLCFGELCEEGLCVEPECAGDADCGEEGQGSFFCDEGRCESFVPCGVDAECFSADFFCNDLGRCEERPACSLDDDCGLEGLCLQGRCRPTESCLADPAACDDDRECVAGRCVPAPGCRENGECGSGEVCVRGACRDETLASAAAFALQTPHGVCGAAGEGACRLVLFEGEGALVGIAAFDDEGAPVSAERSLAASASDVISLVEQHRAAVLVSGTGAGEASLELSHGGAVVHEALALTVLPAATGLRVLVVDEQTGAPLQGALVEAGDESASTGADGLAAFGAVGAPGEPLWISARHEGRGLAVQGLLGEGDVRLPLPPAAVASSGTAAGFATRVRSTGNDTGPVGTGLVLPSVATLSAASLATLFGPAYPGALEVPLLGDVTLALPASATLQVTLPFSDGPQEVRELAYATTAPGPRGLTTWERRSEVAELFGLFGADATELALDLAATAEGMDVRWRPAGQLEAAPRVPDEEDLDGDGDVSELAPDFSALPSFEVSPSRRPSERVGVLLGPPPAGARPRPLAVVGLVPAGYGFVPAGLGAPVLDEASTPRQLKAVSPDSDALSYAPRAVVVEALFDDGRESRLQRSFDAYPAALDLGPFLEPPSGYFFLDGVPQPGARSLVLPAAPGATTWRVHLEGSGTTWTVVATAPGGGGRTLVFPPAVAASSLLRVDVLRLPGPSADEATLAPFRGGAGPLPAAEERAEAMASSD